MLGFPTHTSRKRRHIGRSILLVASAAVLGATVATTAAGDPDTDDAAAGHGSRHGNLRVMTFNIRHGENSAGTLDLSATAAAIRAERPDVVALQEVDATWSERSNWSDEPQELGRMLHMQAFLAPIYDLPPTKMGAADRRYGVAILSRYPIIDSQDHQITRLSTQVADAVPVPASGFAEIAIKVGRREVHVYNTHLDYRSDPSVRETQVEETLQYIQHDPAPSILTGDLNATPRAPELKPLLAAMNDVWTEVGKEHLPSYPADQPTEAIDYILTSVHWQARSVSIPDTEVSDHRPVVANLHLAS